MIFVLWCHTVGNVPKRNCSFVGKMLHSPALILYHYKSSSISCTSTAGWLLIFSLYPSLSHTSPTHSSASTSSSLFSPIFAILLIFSCPFIFRYYYIFLCLLFIPSPFPHLSPDKWSQSHACTLVGYTVEGWREGEKSSLASETDGDDERIRCFVWMT